MQDNINCNFNRFIQCLLFLINIMGGVLMAFQLKQNRKESENKTIRFPLPLIQEIESVIANQDVTFSSFVLQACEYALKNMDTDENKSE